MASLVCFANRQVVCFNHLSLPRAYYRYLRDFHTYLSTSVSPGKSCILFIWTFIPKTGGGENRSAFERNAAAAAAAAATHEIRQGVQKAHSEDHVSTKPLC